MIYRISKKLSDKKYITNLFEKKQTQEQKISSFYNVIVKKPWGYEYLVFENNYVSIWMLHIARKRKTSMHCHPNKKTSLVLLSGIATCYHFEETFELEPLSGLIIEEGAFHSTEASSSLPIYPVSENGIWVLEIESPPLKTDLLRLKDEYGRSGTSYEDKNNMVSSSKHCLKLKIPRENEVFQTKFFDCLFSIRKGLPEKINKDTLISIIGYEGDIKNYYNIGEVTTFEDFCKNEKLKDLKNYIILTIEREDMLMKLSDYVFSFISELNIKVVFSVCGGGAMHLVDSLGKNESLSYIATHHEQAASMAAEAYARISGNPGAALVTSGPGGTNTITGVCGAWIDSIPVIFISGQVTSDTLSEGTGLRQFGIQETNIVELVKPITKYAVTITDPSLIKYHLQKAIYMATTGRPGPVWIDIPLDIQSKLININELKNFIPEKTLQINKINILKSQISETIKLLKSSKRPVLIAGYGIKLAKSEIDFLHLLDKLNIPLITSWTASDLVDFKHNLFIGRSGIMGDRAGNFTVQNSDLLLIIGSRLSIPQVGYNYQFFAREAKKIMVDIDMKELTKSSLKIDIPINADIKDFIMEMTQQLDKEPFSLETAKWLDQCKIWKEKYPVVLSEYKCVKDCVNSFYFIDVLSEKLPDDAVVVTDMGTSFTCTMQSFKIKKGQKLFTSGGHASMGFGLPGSIGACFANNCRKVICITGDGGLQMNIQELQTVVHHNLPIIIFVLNNNGYLTIKLMQQNHFGRYIGSDKNSGLSCPDIIKIAKAYGIKHTRICNHDELNGKIDKILSKKGPFLCEIIMSETQPLNPRVSSLKKPDGSIVSKPLEDLYPFLDRKEFFANMFVKPLEILEE